MSWIWSLAFKCPSKVLYPQLRQST